MAFKKMVKRPYPPRLWSLVGYPGSGKSTFAAQMKGPMLVVDADHRFSEVLDIAGGEVLELSDSPADNVDAGRISAILAQNMPGSNVGTIVVDSLTALIVPLVVRAIRDNDAGLNKNLVAAFKEKALAMRQLQDSITCWGTNVLWIYHLQDARDAKARAITRATISETERARLLRSVNLQLEIVQQGEKRGVKVVWARRGRAGMTLWDESGTWAGMPEKIEAAVYDGLSSAEQAGLASATPTTFPNPETAIAWGFEQGVFEALQHARNAYDKLKREHNPQSAQEMAALWVADVRARLPVEGGEGASQTEEETELASAEATPAKEGSEAVEGEDMQEDNCPHCGVPGLFHSGPFDECPARGSGEEPVEFVCKDCGRPLQDYQANGKKYTVSQLVDIGQNSLDGSIRCGPCLKKRKEETLARQRRKGE
jgi:hypothetical protein